MIIVTIIKTTTIIATTTSIITIITFFAFGLVKSWARALSLLREEYRLAILARFYKGIIMIMIIIIIWISIDYNGGEDDDYL